MGQALIGAHVEPGRQQFGCVLRIAEQQFGQLEGELGERVGDRVLIEPHAERSHHRQRCRVVAGHRGHLGRDHGPKRMPDEMRFGLQRQRVDDVPTQQRKVEHVLDRALV